MCCEHGIVYGFHMMIDPEGRKDLFYTLYERLPQAVLDNLTVVSIHVCVLLVLYVTSDRFTILPAMPWNIASIVSQLCSGTRNFWWIGFTTKVINAHVYFPWTTTHTWERSTAPWWKASIRLCKILGHSFPKWAKRSLWSCEYLQYIFLTSSDVLAPQDFNVVNQQSNIKLALNLKSSRRGKRFLKMIRKKKEIVLHYSLSVFIKTLHKRTVVEKIHGSRS